MLLVVTIETLVPKMIAKIFFLSNASVRNLKLYGKKLQEHVLIFFRFSEGGICGRKKGMNDSVCSYICLLVAIFHRTLNKFFTGAANEN